MLAWGKGCGKLIEIEDIFKENQNYFYLLGDYRK